MDKVIILLSMHGKYKILEHSIKVAEMNKNLAHRFNLDINKCETAALCHDIAGIIKPDLMLDYAKSIGMYIDPSEEKYPFLLHQRLSAIIAESVFDITDDEILSPIRHHTTLKSDPTLYDAALFVADKLAWDQDGTPPFYDIVSSALDESLYHAAYQYIRYIIDYGMILYPHKWLMEAESWLETKIY